MPIQPAKGLEPIPGYQLLERLGSGGYGEVWKTTAPGGLTKALKMVFGDLAGQRAEQEFKALGRIKEVRHPFLLSLERVEISDGQLLIVTELADKSLLDRFEECRKAGLKGIPRDELLTYLRDAAEALDYMGETHGLQHLDIKPQNMLLVGGRIKVADFGLVKDLVGTSVTATGGATPLYATPEAFDGRVSRFSDQYSLAVVYQEMLTSVRPFPGTTALQLAHQHATGRPLLDPLPPSDRPVIARALAKVPEQRFPTCRAMVEGLVRGQTSALPTAAPAGPPTKQSVSLSPPPSLSQDLKLLQLPTEANAAVCAGPAAAKAQIEPSHYAIPSPLSGGKVALRPTLFLGIGGLACATLQRLRLRLHRRFGDLPRVPILRMLLVDTDRAALGEAGQGEPGAALDAADTILASLYPPEHYRSHSRTLLQWLDRRWLYGIPRSLHTEGLRPLGRLALVTNAGTILPQLRETLSEITRPESLATAVTTTGLELRAEAPRVFVIASIAGGTGGGMLLTMAYALRQILGELHLPDDDLCGLLLHATCPKPAAKKMARINALATLQELDHFHEVENSYPGDPAYGLASFGPEHRPLPDCYLVHLGDDLSDTEAEAATDLVAEYLYLDTATEGGTFFDQCRQSPSPSQDASGGNPPLRTFGLSRISFPRYRLVEYATNLFCKSLVARWPGLTSDADQQEIEPEAQQMVASEGLNLEAFVKHLLADVAEVLGEDPETYFPRILAADIPSEQSPAIPEISKKTLDKLDRLLGTGRVVHDKRSLPSTPFETTIQQKADEWGAGVARSLVGWLIRLVDDPKKRLQAADAAAGWLVQHLLSMSEVARAQLNELGVQRDLLRQQLAKGDLACKESGPSRLGLGWRQRASGKPYRKFLDYCWQRLGEIAVENHLAVIGRVLKEISAFTQDALLCRQKLNLFAERFTPARGGSLEAPVPKLTEVLPGGVDSLAAAAANLLKNLSPDCALQVDEAFQTEVVYQQGGLWSLVLGRDSPTSSRRAASLAFRNLVSPTSESLQGLKEELQSRTRAVILAALQEFNAAGLFLESHGDPELARKALLERVEEAQPRLVVPGGWQHLVLALPEGAAGTTLREMVVQALPHAPITAINSGEDVALCYEAAHLPLREMAAALVGGDAIPAELVQQVMARSDVKWFSLAPAAT